MLTVGAAVGVPGCRRETGCRRERCAREADFRGESPPPWELSHAAAVPAPPRSTALLPEGQGDGHPSLQADEIGSYPENVRYFLGFFAAIQAALDKLSY
jgi:hypothetical protein